MSRSSTDVTTEDIADLLQRGGHYGRENAITSSEIAASLGVAEQDGDSTNPVTREIIRETIKDEHIPIGSGPTGYYIIEDPAELEDVLGGLRGRIAGMEQRMSMIAAAWNVHRRGVDPENGQDDGEQEQSGEASA